jgi:hypothetical protein
MFAGIHKSRQRLECCASAQLSKFTDASQQFKCHSWFQCDHGGKLVFAPNQNKMSDNGGIPGSQRLYLGL